MQKYILLADEKHSNTNIFPNNNLFYEFQVLTCHHNRYSAANYELAACGIDNYLPAIEENVDILFISQMHSKIYIFLYL